MTLHRHRLIATLLASVVATPALAQAVPDPGQGVAAIIDAEGAQVGSANLTDGAAEGVLIGVQVNGLPTERWIAMHIHEGGECDPGDAFESAGGHFNPEGRDHGYLVEGGPHAGDMPNQFVPENGVLRAQVFNHMVSLDSDAAIRGRTLVFHSLPDDYETQPSGDAGDRLACGVIE
jgi:superoxide dismutase, Cu-Zn family